MFYRILAFILIACSSLCVAEEIQFPIVEGETFYTFNVTVPGSYVIWGRVSAPDASSDSLWLMIDGDTLDRIWDLERTKVDEYTWDAANERDGEDPIIVNFTTGVHSISLRPREDGAKISHIILSNGPSKPNKWLVTLSFKHTQPTQVASFNMYCKAPTQIWSEGYKWSMPNTMSAPEEEQEFTTPLLPADIFYCFAVSAVSHTGEETIISNSPDFGESYWACMFIKPEDMSFVE